MEKEIIRIKDGTFASVPRVARLVEDGEVYGYVWFKKDNRHVYVYTLTGALGTCGNDTFVREELNELVECSAEEYNNAVMAATEKRYLYHE